MNTLEEMIPCVMCNSTGSKKIRQRARGKGTRYGPCRYCNGNGFKKAVTHLVNMEIEEISPLFLRFFLCGNDENVL